MNSLNRLNPILFNPSYSEMNTIFVNINVGSDVSPENTPNRVLRPEPSIDLSPLSLSSLSPSSGYSTPTLRRGESKTSQMIPKFLANNAMFDPIRYKTEMCKNFQELGICKFGEKCYYAHFESELKVATYKHKNYKTQLCKPFHSEGFCDFGARCAFIHSKPDIGRIVANFESFLSSALPMPDLTADEESAKSFKSKNEKRLKVFKNLSSN